MEPPQPEPEPEPQPFLAPKISFRHMKLPSDIPLTFKPHQFLGGVMSAPKGATPTQGVTEGATPTQNVTGGITGQISSSMGGMMIPLLIGGGILLIILIR